jgi:3-oxoisoapionate decarboxylase
MKLGIGSYTYTWAVGVPGQMPARPMTAMDLCRKAEELGVSVVQLCENVPLTPEDSDRLMDWTRERPGFQLEFGMRGLNETVMASRGMMAARHGSRFVRLVIDDGTHEPSPQEAIAWLREASNQLPPGVQIAVENHDRFNALTLLKIVQSVPGAGITLDTVNSFGALEGPQHVVETLARYVLSLHVKDFTVRRVPSQMGFAVEGCPAGDGRLDIPWLLDRIRKEGRDPNAIIELWTPAAATLDETIAREAEWAKRSVDYMRPLLAD